MHPYHICFKLVIFRLVENLTEFRTNKNIELTVKSFLLIVFYSSVPQRDMPSYTEETKTRISFWFVPHHYYDTVSSLARYILEVWSGFISPGLRVTIWPFSHALSSLKTEG